MKQEWAILGGAALIAAAVAMTNHWDMKISQAGGLLRLDRWTGEISVCDANDETKNLLKGKYVGICNN